MLITSINVSKVKIVVIIIEECNNLKMLSTVKTGIEK